MEVENKNTGDKIKNTADKIKIWENKQTMAIWKKTNKKMGKNDNVSFKNRHWIKFLKVQ